MSRGTLDPAVLAQFSLTGLSPSLAGLSRTVLLTLLVTYAVRTPECTHSGLGSFPFARLWALSLSLAATQEITIVFSSSGYLDVSVHRVPSVHLLGLRLFSAQ